MKIRLISFTSFAVVAMVAMAEVVRFDYMGLSYSGNKETGQAVVDGGCETTIVIPAVAHHIHTTYEQNSNGKWVEIQHDDPYTVTAISSWAFEDCTILESVTIPNTVTKIGESAFEKCTSLKSVTIPNSVTRIEDGTFRGCTSLETVTIPNSVTSIGRKSSVEDDNNHLDEVFNDDYMWPYGAFQGCTSLKNVTLSNSITYIGANTFKNCTKLTKVFCPESLTHIARAAFLHCTSLAEVHLSSSLAEICCGAFSGCSCLKELTIPASVTHVGYEALPVLKTLRWDAVNCEDDHIWEGALGHGYFGLLAENIVFGNHAETIPRGFSEWNDSLRTVVFSESVKEIKSGGFFGCDKLETLVFSASSSLEKIGEYAFDHCPSLTAIALPEAVQVIGYKAFEGCVGVVAISIPSTVREIGSLAFHIPDSTYIWDNIYSQNVVEWRHATGVQSITCHIQHPATVTYGTDSDGNRDQFIAHQTNSYDQWECSNGIDVTTCRLLVPKGAVEEYRNTLPWSDFVHIEEIDDHSGHDTDVNGDHITDIDDLNIVINIILSRPSPFADNADVNHDRAVDIDDVNAIINAMLGRH